VGKSPPVGVVCRPNDAACGTRLTASVLTCTDTWSSYGQNFFLTTCIGACHRHDTWFTTVADVAALADSIRLDVETGSMPVGQTLSASEQRRLLTWLACGAP
jgi:hypothetical protein